MVQGIFFFNESFFFLIFFFGRGALLELLKN